MWVLEAIKSLGGTATILEVSEKIWADHEKEIRSSGKLLFNWQYEMRWAATGLRRQGLLADPATLPRGTRGLKG